MLTGVLSRDRTVPWVEAARAIGAGDFGQAAAVLGEIGFLPGEAYTRLRSGSEPDVRRALAFYESVGATRYLREGEALLAASTAKA